FTAVDGYLGIPGFNGLSTIDTYRDTQLNAEINILPFAGVRVRDPDQLTPWLQALDSRGLAHLQIVNNWMEGSRARPFWARDLSDESLGGMLTATMRNKPGALGYYTFDEPRPHKRPAVLNQYRFLAANDPGSVAYGVLVDASQVFRWRDLTDAI